jgi:hypothetical protein
MGGKFHRWILTDGGALGPSYTEEATNGRHLGSDIFLAV